MTGSLRCAPYSGHELRMRYVINGTNMSRVFFCVVCWAGGWCTPMAMAPTRRGAILRSITGIMSTRMKCSSASTRRSKVRKIVIDNENRKSWLRARVRDEGRVARRRHRRESSRLLHQMLRSYTYTYDKYVSSPRIWWKLHALRGAELKVGRNGHYIVIKQIRDASLSVWGTPARYVSLTGTDDTAKCPKTDGKFTYADGAQHASSMKLLSAHLRGEKKKPSIVPLGLRLRLRPLIRRHDAAPGTDEKPH